MDWINFDNNDNQIDESESEEQNALFFKDLTGNNCSAIKCT